MATQTKTLESLSNLHHVISIGYDADCNHIITETTIHAKENGEYYGICCGTRFGLYTIDAEDFFEDTTENRMMLKNRINTLNSLMAHSTNI